MKDIISIIVPCYNEQEVILKLYKVLNEVTDVIYNKTGAMFEFLFIDDGSTDMTLELLKEISLKDNKIKYFSFSRNFGKEAAMLAGLKHSNGDYIAIIDADMQDPPQLLEHMYEQIKLNDYDCIATRRKDRTGEPPIRSFFSKLFYIIVNLLSKTYIVDGARDFRIMTRRMVNAILEVGEYNRFSKGIFNWVGFNTKYIEYENIERYAGKTKWSFYKLFIYSLEGIVAFSTIPLALASLVGVVVFVIALFMVILIVVKTLIWGEPVQGYPTIICIILLIGGIQLLCMGILGQYVSKIYLESKHRPVYIIKESN